MVDCRHFSVKGVFTEGGCGNLQKSRILQSRKSYHICLSSNGLPLFFQMITPSASATPQLSQSMRKVE